MNFFSWATRNTRLFCVLFPWVDLSSVLLFAFAFLVFLMKCSTMLSSSWLKQRMWVASSSSLCFFPIKAWNSYSISFNAHHRVSSASSLSLSLNPRRRMEQSEHVKTECQVPSSMERYVWEEKKCIIKISCLHPRDSGEGRLTTASSTKHNAHLLNTPEYPRLHITGTKNCYFWKACPNSVLMYLFNFLFTSMEQTLCARTHVSLCFAFSTMLGHLFNEA